MKTGKVILVGSADVGKTWLIRKFLDRKWDADESSTVWPSVFRFRFTTEEGTLSIEVWDTAGQERFRPVVRFYMKNADVAVIVFDVTRSVTFTEAKTWANDASHNSDKWPSLILVGNKRDLWRRRVVSREEASTYAGKIGALYLENSAKDYQDVSKVFNEAAKAIFRYHGESISRTETTKGANPVKEYP